MTTIYLDIDETIIVQRKDNLLEIIGTKKGLKYKILRGRDDFK